MDAALKPPLEISKAHTRNSRTQPGRSDPTTRIRTTPIAYPREVIEHALAHQLKDKAEAAYARGTLFDKRRRLLADWATCCNRVKKAEGETVVPIRKGKTT